MNASSNFNIINSILTALKERNVVKIHTPGVNGEIGGYPYMINGTATAKGYIDESIFSLEEMRRYNRDSIMLDGIDNVENGYLTYTDKLLQTVKNEFAVRLPKSFNLEEANDIAERLINEIIIPSSK